jgi:hypothetical protein
MASDPVWNTPEPVEIYGRQFMVKELPAGKLRMYLREVMSVIGRAAAIKDPTESGLRMIEESGDQLWALVGESTGITPPELDELPGRVFMRLLDEVIKAQEPMVKDFLAVHQRVDALVEPFRKEKRNGGTGRPNLLASLSPQGSPSNQSSND